MWHARLFVRGELLKVMLTVQPVMQVVTVTGTTTSGKPLSEENLGKALDGCTMAMQLDEDKRDVSGCAELTHAVHTILFVPQLCSVFASCALCSAG